MAGYVASAFRNISIRNNIVFLFTGRIKEENVIPVITYMTPSAMLATQPDFFNYHCVDDHIKVAANIGTYLENL
ncbi:Secreted protein [Phytophthora megakarya]|uniref:Secreted protein n=1 Tax=Phytophthora megakarya TaxID=4795 RepID=A0A225WR75_9STRA|nr:Secreted protein [Phytophthora megakarya]